MYIYIIRSLNRSFELQKILKIYKSYHILIWVKLLIWIYKNLIQAFKNN